MLHCGYSARRSADSEDSSQTRVIVARIRSQRWQSFPTHRHSRRRRRTRPKSLRWLSKDEKIEIGRAPRDALANAPDIRSVLDSEISDRSNAGLTSRATIGRYLQLMSFLGRRTGPRQSAVTSPDGRRTASDRHSAVASRKRWRRGRRPDRRLRILLRRGDQPDVGTRRFRSRRRNHRVTDYLMVLFVMRFRNRCCSNSWPRRRLRRGKTR